MAIAEHDQLFIGGRWVPSRATGRIDVRSASTEEVIGCVPDATKADVDRAVAAAREAFDEGPFPRLTPEERADAIRRLSEAIEKRAPAIAVRVGGGFKQSGIGRELGPERIAPYTEYRTIILPPRA